MHGIRAAVGFLRQYYQAGVPLFTMGSGAGFELKALYRFLSFENIFASDISWMAAHVIEKSLESADGILKLFACDFNACPLKRHREGVCFVFGALHHTDDVHKTIDMLLNRHFDRLVFVEPTRNWLVNILSRFGLAMNIEYSGLKPDWIDLRRVREIARTHGCEMDATTWWPIPPWGVPKVVKNSRTLSLLLCSFADLFSWLTAPFSFGSMSAVHIRRVSNKPSEATP